MQRRVEEMWERFCEMKKMGKEGREGETGVAEAFERTTSVSSGAGATAIRSGDG